MNASTHLRNSLRPTMDLFGGKDPATVAASVTGTLLALAAGIRYSVKTFFKDKVDVNAAGATFDVINNLRLEVSRLSQAMTELSQAHQEVRNERDQLRTEVTHLTFAVNALRDVIIELVGKEEALKRFKERGLGAEHDTTKE